MKVAFNVANKKEETEKGKEEALDEEEFLDFYNLLMRRPEIDKLFDKYADDEVMVFTSLFFVFNVSLFRRRLECLWPPSETSWKWNRKWI